MTNNWITKVISISFIFAFQPLTFVIYSTLWIVIKMMMMMSSKWADNDFLKN